MAARPRSATAAASPKHALRVEAYGTVDEANAAIGLARLHAAGEADAMLARIQNDLFDLGADLCDPGRAAREDEGALRIVAAQVERLEREIDALNAELQPLDSFVLPGGTAGRGLSPSRAHRRAPGRAAGRRARRGASRSIPRRSNTSTGSPTICSCSRRHVNDQGARDVLWRPGATAEAAFRPLSPHMKCPCLAALCTCTIRSPRRKHGALGGEGRTMKVLVAVKRVIDFNVKIRVKADQTGVETANVKMSMNPFDEIAVEEAVRLKEAGTATEIVAVSIGPAAVPGDHPHRARHGRRPRHPCADRRRAAAAGGGQAAEGDRRQGTAATSSSSASRRSTTIATRPARCWRRCWAGRRRPSPPSSCSTTARREVTREVDGGLETVALKLPAVVTTDLRLNEPRYASLPNIMKAKKKPIEQIDARGARRRRRAAPRTLKVEEPPKRQGGGKVASVEELVDKLKNEARVI